MFTGGASLFDLSTLLEYRNGENPPNVLECIKKIEEKSIRVIVLIVCMHVHTYTHTCTQYAACHTCEHEWTTHRIHIDFYW